MFGPISGSIDDPTDIKNLMVDDCIVNPYNIIIQHVVGSSTRMINALGESNMKILFFGRGVVSTQYAWAFEQAGHTVEFYVRKGRKETFGSRIELEMWDARKGKKLIKESWNVNLHEEILPNYDLIIVSVNTEQLPEAAQFLSTAAGNTPILLFNNIWQDLKSSIAPLSMNNVVFGFPGAGGGIADNKLRGGFLKMVLLENPRAGTEPINNKVKALFESAHFKINWVKDMQNWLWNHFARNAAMEAEVLKRGKFPSDPEPKRTPFPMLG
ncbi:hypothetical protein OMP38_17165 [Cohnella ginsengisoli]|uniref:Ketopantoate reductase N-terminal domain-containing protein n=1 Tax=Cohnella ginsengisoli TaxID=425004 RepID=A0A9X4QP73_9BACL|nr:2-dehydropantoate 2-reductase N-terminal domain-containing protein [Cohnella ginsengisoli]MDG0792410.1 hypothetical protein [Cohnella ginsengisoli]